MNRRFLQTFNLFYLFCRFLIYRGPLGSLLGPLLDLWEPLGGVVEASWGPLGPSQGYLGPYWRPLGPSSGRLGVVLEPSWEALERS